MDAPRYDLRDPATQTAADTRFQDGIGPYFEASSGSTRDKLANFTRFVPRQNLALFLAKAALFEQVITCHGAIVECGVFMGGGLFTWAQLSAIHEPVNHNRRVVGFDSFDGFPDLSEADQGTGTAADLAHKTAGGYRFEAQEELEQGAALFDLNRPIGHIPKIELVRGDATRTIPTYMEDNPHLVVALLYLDFDLYEPTLAALRHFLPRMPKGAVLAFDELNQAQWPGETRAVLEEVGLRNLAIKRFAFTPSLSYAVLD